MQEEKWILEDLGNDESNYAYYVKTDQTFLPYTWYEEEENNEDIKVRLKQYCV